MATDITLTQMMAMQRALWEKYREQWSPMEPSYARNSLLWMIGEIGEVIDIIKKRGDMQIMNDPGIRAAFLEELCDVQMYFNDVLMRYQVTADEFAQSYEKKHRYNIQRDFDRE